jgi:hypothetical protein
MSKPSFICCPDTDGRDDLALAHSLLHGFIVEGKRGLQHRKYFRAGDDKEARRALARVLRGDALDRSLRLMLAAMIDPDEVLDFFHGKGPGEITEQELSDACLVSVVRDRRLEIKFRSREPRRDSLRDGIVSKAVRERMDQSISYEEAVAEVAKKFDLSEGNVRRIWGKSTERWQRNRNMPGRRAARRQKPVRAPA